METNITRRRVMQMGIVGATGVGTLGVTSNTKYEMVGASRAFGIGPIDRGISIAAGYLVNEAIEYFTGDSTSADEYEGLEAEQVHTTIYEKALSMEGGDDTVLTMVNNRLNNTTDIAWTKAKKAGIEQFNLENSETEAETAAHSAVEDYYATIQRNLVNHWIEQMNKWEIIREQAQNTDGLSFVVGSNPVLYYNPSRDDVVDSRIETRTVNLVNGESISNVSGYGFVEENSGYPNSDTSQGIIFDQFETELTGASEFYIQPPDGVTGDNIPVLDITVGTEENEYDGFNGYRWRFVKADKRIETQVTELKDEVSTYITELYASDIAPGDIDLTNFLDPSEIASEYGTEDEDGNRHYGYAGAELAALGLSTNFNVQTDIQLVDDDITVKGQLFFDDPNLDIEPNVEYDPETISGAVFMAYEYEDENGEMQSDLAEVQQPFVVLKAVDLDTGEEVESIGAQNYVAQTSDVTATEEELEKINQLQTELAEQQEKIINLQEDDEESGGGIANPLEGNFLVRRYYGIPVWFYGAVGSLVAYTFGGSE